MSSFIATRAGSQSDDPDLRQAVAALPGAILRPLWHKSITREARKPYVLLICAEGFLIFRVIMRKSYTSIWLVVKIK
jgi:hypothetical protein